MVDFLHNLCVESQIDDSSFFELASCSKLGPIYTEVLEKTVCTHSAESSTFLFQIMFAISFVGMFMVTLRAALYPKYTSDATDKDGSSTNESTYDASIESVSQSDSASRMVPTNLTRRSNVYVPSP